MPKEKWIQSGKYEWEGKYCISGFIINSLFGDLEARNICDFGDMLRAVDKTKEIPLSYLWAINDEADTFEEAVSGGVEYLQRVGL